MGLYRMTNVQAFYFFDFFTFLVAAYQLYHACMLNKCIYSIDSNHV